MAGQEIDSYDAPSWVVNPTDDLTKPLSWVLHGRHARRNMGHYVSSSSSLPSPGPSSLVEGSALEAGEGVGGDTDSPVGDVSSPEQRLTNDDSSKPARMRGIDSRSPRADLEADPLDAAS